MVYSQGEICQESQSNYSKVDMVDKFLEYAKDKGIAIERIFVDPGLETMANKAESAKIALQTISTLKDKYPKLNYTVGLTNIGYGLGEIKKTKALQQAFLKLGMRTGLNSAIASPTILKEKFKQKDKSLSESIEFIAGLEDNTTYAMKIMDSAYENY